jgi:hypothetical protein
MKRNSEHILTVWLVVNCQLGDAEALQQLIKIWYPKLLGYAYHLVNELDIGLKINWLAGTLSTVVAFAIARIWFFMELNRLSVIREIKRVELQVSLLAESYQK